MIHEALKGIQEKFHDTLETLSDEMEHATSNPVSLRKDINFIIDLVNEMNAKVLMFSQESVSCADIAYENYSKAVERLEHLIEDKPLPVIPWVGNFAALNKLADQLEGMSSTRWDMIAKLAEIFKEKPNHE